MLEGFVLSVDEMGVGSAMVGLSGAEIAMLADVLRASETGPAFDFSEYCLKPPHHCRGEKVSNPIIGEWHALKARSRRLVTVAVLVSSGFHI